jgi:hypothetical protein
MNAPRTLRVSFRTLSEAPRTLCVSLHPLSERAPRTLNEGPL